MSLLEISVEIWVSLLDISVEIWVSRWQFWCEKENSKKLLAGAVGGI